MGLCEDIHHDGVVVLSNGFVDKMTAGQAWKDDPSRYFVRSTWCNLDAWKIRK
jgi:hypothetical protein